MRAHEFLVEYTKDDKDVVHGWTVRHEYGVKKGEPVRWMAFNDKRGPSDAHRGTSDSVEAALADAKEWILSGGNQKKEFTSNATIDFNVKFVTEILNGSRDFFATIQAGPKLIVSDEPSEGLKRSHIRTRNVSDSGESTLLPMISMTKNEVTAAGLVPNGRYTLGPTNKIADGVFEFPLIYQTTVQSSGDKVQMSKPGLTVATARTSAGT